MARLRDVDSGDEFTHDGVDDRQRGRARSSTSSTREWGLTSEHRIVFSKGMHLVVPR